MIWRLGGQSGKLRSFEDLDVWKIARSLRHELYEISKRFPIDERYALVAQLRRAAISVTANIAEGFGRFHYQENIQFCRQARGSLFEVLDHLITANDEGYVDAADYQRIRSHIFRCIKVLNGYIASLKRLKSVPCTTEANT